MKWLLTTEKGTQIEIDDTTMTGVVVEIDGVDYDISIEKKHHV